MRNKSGKIALAMMLALTLSTTPTYANEKRFYHITYSPGLIGKFKQSLVDEYKKVYGEEDVIVSKVTGAIRIKASVDENMPNAPTQNDIEFKNAEDSSQYYVKSGGWEPSSTNIKQNETFVVQYGALVDGVDYTIRYVDAITNTDVATPVLGKANKNETIAAYAKNIEGYTFDTQSKTKVLVENAEENILTFYYTAEDDTIYIENVVNNVVPGDVEVVTEPVGELVVPGENQPAVSGEDGTEVVGDNETPLANNNETEETIKDNETPLANNADELKRNNMLLYSGIGIVAVVAVLIAIIAKKKKKVEK